MMSLARRTGWLLAMAVWGICVLAPAAEVRVRLRPLWAEPANIVVHSGDRVTWLVGDDSAATVEGFGGEFTSPVLVAPNPTFSHSWQTPGVFAYHHVWVNPLPPHDPVWWPLRRSAGTVTVLPRPPVPAKVMLYSPPAGARFPAFVDATRNVVRPARIPLFAAVADTNEIVEIDFLADGIRVGKATNWPFEVEWTTERLGPVRLTLTGWDRTGNATASEPVEIRIEGSSGARLFPPRQLQPGLMVTEYMTGFADRWLLNVRSDLVASPECRPLSVYEVYLGSSWGQYPVTGTAAREFFLIDQRK
jgi:hypothetical protein